MVLSPYASGAASLDDRTDKREDLQEPPSNMLDPELQVAFGLEVDLAFVLVR